MRSRLLLGAAAAALVLAAVFALTTTLWHAGVDGPTTDSIDFRAFYCAGDALDRGGDPYRVEPVRSCERATLALAGFPFSEGNVLVAPFPPYVLGVFALFAHLPYRLAVEVWLTLGIVALGATIVLTSALARLRPAYVALALVGSLGFGSLYFGQPVPIVVCALVVAARAARERRGIVCAGALVVATLEPHLAVPAWVAALAFVPSARRPLAVAALALIAFSGVFHPDLGRDYLTQVLPAHARSEVFDFAGQFGLSALLVWLGAAPRAALVAGSASYVAMVALGAWAGRELARRFADPAFAILAPVAFATLGGPFLHGHQTAAAIPFALLLAGRLDARTERAYRSALASALVALAIPWQILAIDPRLVAALPHRTVVARANFRVPASDEPIERSYTERVDAIATQDTRPPALALAWKLPIWLALLTLVATALRVSRGLGRRIDARE